MKKSFSSPVFSAILFSFGILLGIILSTLAAWADYESTAYGFARRAATPLRGLSCPILMTREEIRSVKIQFTNTSGQVLSLSVRTEISTKLVPDSKLEFFDLAPGETLHVERTINSENIDLGQFIFVQAGISSVHPLPSQESTCGVFILPLPGNGTVILVIAAILSVLSISSGLLFLRQNDKLKKHSGLFLFIAIATLLAMSLSFLGLWMQAALLLVLVILTSFIMISIMIN